MPHLICRHSIDPLLVGDPVDTSKGAAIDQTIDFRLTGPLDLLWMRRYDSSQSHRRFALGWGHSHDFERALVFDGDGISYLASIGRLIAFPPLPNNDDEVAREGHVLRRLSLLRYEVRHHAEPSMEFEFRNPYEPARLKRLFQGRHEIRFGYTASGQWERIVDSVGRVIRVEEEADGRIISVTLQARAEKSGLPEKPALLLVAYQYDERGNLVATKDASGHGFSCAYDASNRMIRRTGRKGFSFHFAYDEEGRCTKSAGDGRMHEVNLEYDRSGRMTKVTRADGGIWMYLFSETGGLEKVVDPLGCIQQFVRDKYGRVTLEIDPNRNCTRLVYDAAGASIAKITPSGHCVPLPPDPNALSPRTHRVAANSAEYEYGRLVNKDEIVLPDAREVASMPLSARARQLVVTRLVAESTLSEEQSIQPRPLGPNWWPEPKQGRIFDDLGKLLRQDDDWGRRRHWSYDASGNVVQYQDFDGGKWTFDNGDWHLRLAETNPLGASVRFSYNTAGEVATFVDAGGTRSEYVYDHRDHLVAVKRHGVIRDTYCRDAVGNLIAKYAGDGRLMLQFEIGAANLPVKRKLASGDEHSFQYDKNGRYLLAATKKDKVEFAYDGLGNCCAEKRNGRGVEHRFSGWRRLGESVFFGRFALLYERRVDGVHVIVDPGGKKQRIRFHAHGVVERTFCNGSSEVAQYDTHGRCLFKIAQGTFGQLWSRTYEWSGEGELLCVADSRYGEIRHEYDAAHRLLRRILPGDQAEEYELDVANNILRQPGLDGVRFEQGNCLSAANGLSVGYNGRNHVSDRQTHSGSMRYSYDSRDQMTSVDTPQGRWEAEYDALGRRVRKIWAGDATEYYWNTDQLVAEVAADGRLRLYIYADLLAVTPVMFLDYESVDASVESCKRYFVFGDQIGTPCLVEDESGAEVWSARVAPYGQLQVSPGAKIDLNLRFPGHYHDPELDLHYNRFRYYDPYLGRYLQSDPLGLGGGYNVYAYRSNPLLTSDVRGLGEQDGKSPCEPKEDEELPPGMTRKEYDDLKAEMRNLAESALTRMLYANEAGDRTVTLEDGTVLKTSDSGMGPCLSVVKDLKTGEIFYGQNTGKQPENMAAPLQKRADVVAAVNQASSTAPEGYPAGWSRDKGIPGSHSECQALNQGLQARPGSTPEDFAVYNIRTKDNQNGNAGDPMQRCDNCKPITDGIIPLTD